MKKIICCTGILILCGIFYSPFVFASLSSHFKILFDELNEKNEIIARSKFQIEMAKLERDELGANRSWNVSTQANHRDDFKEGVSLFDTNATLTDNLNLGLDKQFITGTKTSYKHQITLVDRSRWNPLLIGQGPKQLYTTSNIFYLEQEIGKNIFGAIDRIELRNAQLKVQNVEHKVQWDIEKVWAEFFNNYNAASYHITQLALKKKALERAIKRKEMVERRVQDGLREQVDLIESKSNVLSHQEACMSLEITIKSDLLLLSNLLHRKIDSSMIPPYELTKVREIPDYHTSSVTQNRELISLNDELQLLVEQKKRLDLEFVPQVQLQGEYTSIKNNKLWSDSFEKAIPGASPFRQYRVGVLVTMPLDFPLAQVRQSKLNVQIQTKQIQLDHFKPNVELTLDTTLQRIKGLQDSFRISQKRIELANQVLVEQNRLYHQARRDLDNVIAAEVSLIATEESIVNYIYNMENELMKYAQSYGKLSDYLKSR